MVLIQPAHLFTQTYVKYAALLKISSLIVHVFSSLTESLSPTRARTHTRTHLVYEHGPLNKSGCDALPSLIVVRHSEVMR